MTDIEKKALALLNEVRDERGYHPISESFTRKSAESEALCRAIEQHEATKQELNDFRQKVSDVASVCAQHFCKNSWTVGDRQDHVDMLTRLIIPAPKSDPLAEVYMDAQHLDADAALCLAIHTRAALESRGLEIRSKNDD